MTTTDGPANPTTPNAEHLSAMKFVVGFAFDQLLRTVLLIKKNRPAWQAGKCNGVGGKIEPGEGIRGAMVREFQEECGLVTQVTDWSCFYDQRPIHIGMPEWQTHDVYFLAARVPFLNEAVNTSDESVVFLVLDQWGCPVHADLEALLFNMHFLIPMAHCWLKHPEHRYV